MNIKVSIVFRETYIDAYDVLVRDGKKYTIPECQGKLLVSFLQKGENSNKFYKLGKDYYRGYDILSFKHTKMSFADLSEGGKAEVLLQNPDLFKEKEFPELKDEIKKIQDNSKQYRENLGQSGIGKDSYLDSLLNQLSIGKGWSENGGKETK